MAERVLEKRARQHNDVGAFLSGQTGVQTEARLIAQAIHHLGETIAVAADELTRLLASGVPYPAGRPQSQEDEIWRILHSAPSQDSEPERG